MSEVPLYTFRSISLIHAERTASVLCIIRNHPGLRLWVSRL